MDVISGLLDGPRAQGAFLLRSLLEPPWSLRIQDEAPLTLVAVVRGQAWVMFDSAEPIRLDAGSVAITGGSDHYTVADSPETKPQIIIHPGQRCTTPDGFDLHQAMSLGVRSWGNSRTGSTVMLTGTYQFEGEVSRRLLAALPPRLALDAAALDSPLVEILSSEIVRDAPGQPACRRSRNPPGGCSSYPAVGSSLFLVDRVVVPLSAGSCCGGRRVDR
jgi:Cupin